MEMFEYDLLGRGPLLHLLPGPDHDRGDTATLKFPVYKSQTIKLYRTLHTFCSVFVPEDFHAEKIHASQMKS